MTSLMVLMFEWVLKFRIWVLTVIIGTYVYGILVIDGYLCSRVYGIYNDHVPIKIQKLNVKGVQYNFTFTGMPRGQPHSKYKANSARASHIAI